MVAIGGVVCGAVDVRAVRAIVRAICSAVGGAVRVNEARLAEASLHGGRCWIKDNLEDGGRNSK